MVTKQTGASSQLRAVVVRYRAHNDRFEQWLNERDEEARQRTRERLLARGAPGRFLLELGDRVERVGASFRELGKVRP